MSRADPHTRFRALSGEIVLALGILAVCSSAAPAAPLAGEITAALSSQEITLGSQLSVTGRLTSAGQGYSGVPLTLQSDPYPYRGFTAVAHAASSADGSFSFAGVRPDRNTRLRVLSEGAPAAVGPELVATVDPKVIGSARSLGPGRVRLILRVRHTTAGPGRAVSVRWFLAARASRVFRLAAVTATHELSPGVTYASVIVDPPVKRFVYRACMNPPWEAAMGLPATHRRCPDASFVIRRDAR
ncbi:MAG: hypothetical protein E6G62_04115 [Actinobacteria bacterium]|nr:MAG: hypothetical protein E6G62_04115 [Actinomycetota bacterium]